uniref:Aminotransferase-like plant mobile domain-containing protein n=1 Tax=Fagus sylvatica TaxID=28930 RepID=A0A2N9FED4_FAGSY
MTPTMFDVFALLGLSPMGAIAHPLMAVGSGPEDDFLKGMPMGYTEFIKHAKGVGASPVTYKEECLFYLFWICRFLACTSSKRVISYYLPISRCLANGIPVNMASFSLGELYRALSYGEAWMHARFLKEKGIPSFPSCFKLFSDSSRRRSPEEFMPFEAKKYGSKDFRKFSSQGFFRGDSAWGACLQSRDLVVIRSNSAGVEAYCPLLVAYMANFNNEGDLIKAIQGCCPEFLTYQLLDASIEHIASYVTPQPFQQISPSGMKIAGDSSSQKSATAEANLIQDAAFEKAKESVWSQAPPLMLPTPSEQGLIKTTARKPSAKKIKVIEVVLDPPILEVEPLDEDLEDATTLSELTRMAKSEAEEAERKRLKAKKEKKRQADKAEEERIAEITRKLEIKKKEKAQADQKNQQEFERKKREEEKKKQEEEQKNEEIKPAKKKIGQVVPKEAKLTKPIVVAPVVSMQQTVQSAIEVRPSIEAATSSIKAAAPLATHMQEGPRDIDKLLEDVSLTLQQCQTPTKTSSASVPLEPPSDQLQAAIDQLKELFEGGRALLGLFVQNLDSTISNLQAAQEKRSQATSQEANHKHRVSKLQAHHLDLQTKAFELKSIDRKLKSLEAELQLWKSERT